MSVILILTLVAWLAFVVHASKNVPTIDPEIKLGHFQLWEV